MKTNYLLPMLGLAIAGPAFAGSNGPPSQPLDPIRDPYVEMNNAAAESTITATRINTRDVGARLLRKRAGIGRSTRTTQTMPPMDPGAKGGMPKTPIVTEDPRCHEIYGGLFYYTEDRDPQVGFFQPQAGTAAPIPFFARGDTSVDAFGGYVGYENRPNDVWSWGIAVAGSNTDTDVQFSGSSDVDALSFMPYVGGYWEDLFGGVDLWADLLYAYTDLDYDITTFFGIPVTGSPSGESHTLDFNTGLNFGSGTVRHGPYAGLRWIDGEIDGYQNVPVGPFVPGQDVESLASTLGYQASFLIRGGGALWVPQLRAAWEHEFEDDPSTLFGFPLATADEDLAVLGAGLGVYYESGWNWALDYEARIGSETEGHYVGFKLGKEF